MEEFALIKSRVNLNRVNLGIALISDLKVDCICYGHLPFFIRQVKLDDMYSTGQFKKGNSRVYVIK